MQPRDETDYTRLFLAIFLAALVLITWQVKVEWPRRQALAKLAVQVNNTRHQEQAQHAETVTGKETIENDENPDLTRQQRLAASPRVMIASDKLNGSIALKGARFDDLTLVKYRVSLEPDSPGVTLLSPNGDEAGYFAQTGWLSGDAKTQVPDQHTLWEADKKEITPGNAVNLHWKSDEGVTFTITVSLDENYMFHIQQKVENHSARDISVIPYAYINRTYQMPKQANFLHEGPIGVMDGTLNEVTYKALQEKGNKTFDNAAGWFGITDKYWLTALIPEEGHDKVTFSYYSKNNRERYQVDYLNEPRVIAAGSSDSFDSRLFAGAKEITVLDQYAEGGITHPPILLFDRAIDFGSLYFLTKPLLLTLTFFYGLVGNFGIAIMLLTVVIRAALYPLANKSFKSMAQMRALQPEMKKIRERYVEDQIGLHKATRELYKKEKINPAAGCLPMLIQMPIFYSLYKVLYVSIEMRQAPFFGWMKDLSAPDPSNLFTAFGLIPWEPPFGWMHLGLLPILYGVTMIVQTRQQPTPPDPVQAKMMKWMPFMMLVFFAKLPAGLVLYYTCSNTLSILQQKLITKRHGSAKNPKASVKTQEAEIAP